MSEEHFKVSSWLKQLIGSELITDKFVAIFELVKNSFDASATKVTIKFNNIKSNKGSITITDNGHGMSKTDIRNKWLFVAYSDKRESDDYRDNIKNAYAGSKGVGRFSCDRLGKKMTLESKKKSDKPCKITIDWENFEDNQNTLFESVPVQLQESQFRGSNGTIITIFRHFTR